VRGPCEISPDVCSDVDLNRLFRSVDKDDGGDISAEEFITWLEEEAPEEDDSWFPDVVGAFLAATAHIVTKLGWTALFEKYDDDGSGELEVTRNSQGCPNIWGQLQASNRGFQPKYWANMHTALH
jgi:hypothetical protein